MEKALLYETQAPGLSIEQRFAAGKKLRNSLPRYRLGDFEPPVNRPDPVAILEQQGRTRLPELLPIRYARMLTSPFAFLRGSAAIMAADLASGNNTTGVHVQSCGDMHVANFGVFASADRNLIFGINDFDETLPGPWEWDLKRLVASIVASGRYLGADDDLIKEGIRDAIKSYRTKMKEYAYMGNLELWYATISEKDILKTINLSQKKALKKITDKARTHTHMQVLDKLTDLVDKKYRLKDNAPFIIHESHTTSGRPIKEALNSFLQSYFNSLAEDRKKLLRHYQIVDVVRKVVGVGSVGTRCWVVLLKGNSMDDPLFLQVKEAQASVLQPFLSSSVYSSHGERVVQGQRLIQGAPDIFLGWGQYDGIHFYVRQLRDMKGGVDFNPETTKFENIPLYCRLCAWALALAHAKSGNAAMIAGYAGNCDELDEAMVRFAFTYATQNEEDFHSLAEASKRGRVLVA